MSRTDCTDLLIRIFPRSQDDGHYPVEATLSDGSFFHGMLRLDPAALLERQRRPDEYGRILCEALFSGPIGRAYDLAQGVARARSEGRLRVRLWIDDEGAELQALPWERLYHYYDEGLSPLSVTARTPFSRYTGLAIARPLPMVGDVRVLFAIASPRDPAGRFGLRPVDVEGEVSALCAALADIPQLRISILPGQSGLSPELGARLRADPRCRLEDGPTSLDRLVALLPDHQVLHFLGHGRLAQGAPILYMEREGDGQVAAVTGDELLARLRPGDMPRLVFLAACESASSLADRPFGGLGPTLVRAGVPAVVAMQGLLPMALSPRLQGAFYRQLLQHGYVDLALNAARNQIFSEGGEGWDIPVLYTRLETAQLFAPDPLYVAIESLCDDERFQLFASPRYLKLPITVRHHRPPSASRGSDGDARDSAAMSLSDAVDEIFRLPEGEQVTRGRLAAVLGPHGSNKTTQLQYMIWESAVSSLRERAPGGRRRMPLYISLESFVQSMQPDAIRGLLLAALRRHWPDAGDQILAGRPGQPTLRIVFDDLEALSAQQRDRVWRELAKLAADYPAHEYIVAGRPEFFLKGWFAHSPDAFLPGPLQWRLPPPLQGDQIDLHVLVVQPLSPAEIRRFLRGVRGAADGRGRRFGDDLLYHLERSRLTDLVCTPSFLHRAFLQASAGHPPESRIAMLQQVVDIAVARVPSQHGMRAHAEQTLYRLAWQMHAARQVSWPISRAFAEMELIRGRRGYSLEDLFGELLKSGALAQVGDESLCFAYPPLQAYCCARAILQMPDREQVIDDITASLGRLTRLLWWAEPLACLSGLLQSEPALLEQLLRTMVYGVNLLEGEQCFVAARCLAEVRSRKVVPDLRQRVAYSLIWGLSNSNEPRTFRRERAARALGQLDEPAAIPALCRVANQRQRVNWRGVAEYELSGVRLAAAQTLVPLLPDHSRAIAEADPDLAEVLRLWHAQRIRPLIAHLRANRPETQAIAAFALGDIQGPEAEEALLAAFRDATAEGDSLWAVTEALILLGSPRVASLIAELVADPASLHSGQRQRCLVYLIGRVRYRESAALAFFERGLTESTSTTLIARTLRALGDLHDTGYRGRFEAIAGGDFAYLAAWSQKNSSEDDRIYLRQVAIEELARIGTAEGLRGLRRGRDSWPPKLDEAYYRASEEIAWRQSLRE